MKEWKKRDIAAWFFIAALSVATGTLIAKHGDPFPAKSEAAVPTQYPASMFYGAVNVPTAAAVQVPTACSKSRNAMAVYNNGPNTIWCGSDSSVSNTTGFPIASAAQLAIDVGCNANGTGGLWCRADTADQTSPANTRVLEIH